MTLILVLLSLLMSITIDGETTLPPTLEPTVASSQPSSSPTLSPSNNPSTSPSLSPSFNPSTTPSFNPSESPSNPSPPPTKQPSQSPSNERSASPTSNPSSQPSQASNVPTFNPIAATNEPSQSPSNEPSTSPINDPSKAPTVEPKQQMMTTDDVATTQTDDDKEDSSSNKMKGGTVSFIVGLCVVFICVLLIMCVGYFRLKREDEIKLDPGKYERSSSPLRKKNALDVASVSRGVSRWMRQISINSSRSSAPDKEKSSKIEESPNLSLQVPVRQISEAPNVIEAQPDVELQLEQAARAKQNAAALVEEPEAILSDAELAAKLQAEEDELADEQFAEFEFDEAGADEIELQLAEVQNKEQEYAGEGAANVGEEDLVLGDAIKKDKDEEKPWNCSSCTFANHPSLNQCEVCDNPKSE